MGKPRRHRGWNLLGAALGLSIAAAGCSSEPTDGADAPQGETKTPTEDSGKQPPPAVLSAQELLDRMRAAYRQADSYADSGQVLMRTVNDGAAHDEGPFPLAVAFERPNKLRMTAFGGQLFCDGNVMLASIASLQEQVLQLAAPKRLARSTLPTDEYLQHALTFGMPKLVSPALELLFGESLPEAVEPAERLDEQQLAGRRCVRVKLPAADGTWIYWIDAESYLLRRVDFPTEKIAQQLGTPDLSIWAELTGATFSPEFGDNAFRYEVPAGAKRVRRFVPPVMTSVPPQLGAEIGQFSLAKLDGGKFEPADLKDKITVLDFWFTECLPCRASMPHVDAVYRKFADHDQVQFFAVSIDPQRVPDSHVADTLKKWGGTMPALRDTQRQAEKVFEVFGAPTTVVLRDNRVEAFHVGHVGPELLEGEIQQLLSGVSLADKLVAQYESERSAYERELAAAAADRNSQLVEVPQATIAERSSPARLKLTEIWSCPAVKKPGNILVVPGEAGSPRIFVLDGFRTVVELDLKGKVVARHELAIPERAAVSFLRTAVDGQGRRYFLLAAAGQQQCFVLDADWNLVLSYPEGERHAGIADVQLADLDGDGTLELLVGYWGAVGVQAVSLDGKLLWSNRSMENVFQLALSDADEQSRRRVLCVSTRGTIVPVDHQGRHEADLRVDGHALISLSSSDLDGDGRRELCAIAADPMQLDRMIALGLSPAATELWTYELPSGHMNTPIQRIVPVHLDEGDGGWILPAADGSIQLLTIGGALVDRFNYGQELTGLSLFKTGGRQILLVSSPTGIVALEVE